jgi:hypothetical protein
LISSRRLTASPIFPLLINPSKKKRLANVREEGVEATKKSEEGEEEEGEEEEEEEEDDDMKSISSC